MSTEYTITGTVEEVTPTTVSRRSRPAQRPAPEDGPPPPDDSDLPF